MKKKTKEVIRGAGWFVAVTIVCLIFLAIVAAMCGLGWGLGDYWVESIIIGLLL